MNTINFVLLLVGIAVGALVCWLAMRSAAIRDANRIEQLEASVDDARREKLKIEREFREEISAAAEEHAAASKNERAKAYAEGRQLGQAEGERERVLELTAKQKEFDESLRKECKRVADEARDQARMQFEQQQKMFLVQVSPYVEINEVSTYLTSKYERQIGYQYQLLVNGIPAFDPHVIIESKELIAKTKDENIDKLADRATKVAQQAAQAAIETFLGGPSTFFKLGKAIRRLPGISN